MSYDVSLIVRTGPDQGVEVFDRNYTSNVGPMWRHALGKSLRDFDGAPASEAAGPLAAAAGRMAANPTEYEQWEPANGWGDFEGAQQFLADIAAACGAHPLCTLRVSA